MVYWTVNVGMSLSVVAFCIGYYYRKQTDRHRLFMSLGVGLTLLTAVFLVVAVHAFHGGDFRSAGFYPTVPPWAVLTHRVVATVAALLMLAQAYTGIRRKRVWHLRIRNLFIPFYLIIYVSGLLIFTNHPPQ